MKGNLTAEQLYKRKQRTAKALKIAAPFVFWGLIALSVVCLVFAVRYSFGNLIEIKGLLNSKNHTGDELRANYQLLIDKYGEWQIGQAGGGFTISFVDIGAAMLNGLVIVSAILCILFFLSAYLLGKWLLPLLSAQITQDNQDTVNLAVLRMDEERKRKK